MENLSDKWCELNSEFGLKFLTNHGCLGSSLVHVVLFVFSLLGMLSFMAPTKAAIVEKSVQERRANLRQRKTSVKLTKFDRNKERTPETKKQPKVYPKNPTAPKANETSKVEMVCPNLNRDNRFLLFGSNGWIGGTTLELLKTQGYTVMASKCRLQNRESIIQEIEHFKPTHIINCAGVTGRPNVDWCETHKEDTIRANVIGCLTLCDVAFEKKIHVTNLATGCIYHYDEPRPEGEYDEKINDWVGCGKFHEYDEPNFDGSWYSRTKGYVDRILFHAYDNVLTLRLRMPISDDLSPRNFVTKITNYQKVVNIPNSMSVLYDLIPLMLAMGNANYTGLYNFTNPGVISHNQVLDLYKEIVDNKFEYKNFNLVEHNKVVVAKRSNNELTTYRLEQVAKEVNLPLPHIVQAVGNSFKRSLINYE